MKVAYALTVLLVLLPGIVSVARANNNITKILASHPSYSTFSKLCEQTGVGAAIFSRTTITVLAPPNSALDLIVQKQSFSAQTLYDIVSYHVLLDYFDTAKFKAITKGTTISTTLYQTSGQALGNSGSVNITNKGGVIRIVRGEGGLSAVVQSELYDNPYNISVVSIDTVLVPGGVVGAPTPTPAPVNYTETLIQAKNYNTFLSLIKETGVDTLLLKHDTPPGVTIFAPDDGAFKKLPAGVLSKLSSAEKVALLEFHCLGTFYSTQELAALGEPQATLASGSGGGKYDYNGIFAKKGGGTVIDTGYNKVPLGPTLYSQEPLGLYGISTLLLPTDIFGLAPGEAPSPTPTSSPAPTPSPATTPSPAPSPSTLVPSPGLFAPASAFSPPAPPHGTRSSSLGANENSSSLSAPYSLGILVAIQLLLALLFH